MENAPAPQHQTYWFSIVYAFYLALVCAISLVVGVFTAGSMLQSGVDMLLPRETYVDTTKTECMPLAEPVEGRKSTCVTTELPAEEIAAKQEKEEARMFRSDLRSMAHSAITLLLVGGLFGFHWPLFRQRVRGK